MTEQTTEAPPEQPQPETPDTGAKDTGPKDWAAEAEKWRALARKHEIDAKAGKAAAAKLAALEESQKTEAQKLADRATQAEKERDEARLEALRTKVGASKKLPADVIDLLKGETEEELAAHADRLAEHFKQAARPSGSVDQGQRGGAPTATPQQEFADFITRQMNRTG